MYAKCKRFLSSQKCPDRLRGPPSLQFSGYRRLFPWWQDDRGRKLATYLCPVLRLRITGAIHPHPLIPVRCAQGQLYRYINLRHKRRAIAKVCHRLLVAKPPLQSKVIHMGFSSSVNSNGAGFSPSSSALPY